MSEVETQAQAVPERDGDMTIRFGSGQVYRGNYMDDLVTDERKMNEHLSKQPQLFVFWARMAAYQKMICDRKKLEVEKYESDMDASIRIEKEHREEKVTDKIVAATIKRDPARMDLLKDLYQSQAKLRILEGIKEGFSQRKDTLISLAYNLREEMSVSGGLAVREKEFLEARKAKEE